jgi:hypothetical protein
MMSTVDAQKDLETKIATPNRGADEGNESKRRHVLVVDQPTTN